MNAITRLANAPPMTIADHGNRISRASVFARKLLSLKFAKRNRKTATAPYATKAQPGSDEKRAMARAPGARSTSTVQSRPFGKKVGVNRGQYQTMNPNESRTIGSQSRRGFAEAD